jgi:hypothetical protein
MKVGRRIRIGITHLRLFLDRIYVEGYGFGDWVEVDNYLKLSEAKKYNKSPLKIH